MAKITLNFMQRYQNKLNTAIKDYVISKLSEATDEIETQQTTLAGTSIENGTDLNNMKTTGNYRIVDDSSAGSLINLPLALCGKLIVMDCGNGGYAQIYIPNHSPRLFARNYWSSAWTDWAEYVSKTYVDSAIGELKCNETTAGEYTLKATVNASGEVIYSWTENVN